MLSVLSLYTATTLPDDVADEDIAEEACQAAFKVICDRLEEEGYPVTGDLMPPEAAQIERAFLGFVRAMALNNPTIATLNEDHFWDDDEAGDAGVGTPR
jgi:hypothetical protein